MVMQVPGGHDALRQEQDRMFMERARALRPFYFIVAVWGERYTDFLLNFCIASLLSPNNIPALANRGRNKFLIATTDADWRRMQASPIFGLLEKYAEPVFLRIPPCPPGVSQCTHMGVGHKLATQRAYEDDAYGAILTPDMMLSDGSLAAAQKHAVNGMEVVLTAALRFGEEPLFEHLGKLGVATIDSRFGDEGRPLAVTGKQLVWAGLRSFHSESMRYEWDKPYFASFPSAVWWRVPDEDGIIVHSLSWAPVLIDYGAMKHHDSTVMENWTIDGDYIHRNFGVDGKVHVVQDSDEIMHISWAPLADREQSLEPTSSRYTIPFYGEWEKGAVFHEALSSPIFDPVKRKIFPLPVYWHARDIDAQKWEKVERKATGIIRKYGLWEGITGQGMKGFARMQRVLGIATVRTLGKIVLVSTQVRVLAQRTERLARIAPSYLGRVVAFLRYYWSNRRHVLRLAGHAMRGDFTAWNRIRRSFGFFVKLIKGVPNVYD